MTLWGSKFLFAVFGFIVGLMFASIGFGMVYSVFLPVNASTQTLIAAVFGSLVCGGAISYLTYKCT